MGDQEGRRWRIGAIEAQPQKYHFNRMSSVVPASNLIVIQTTVKPGYKDNVYKGYLVIRV
jgi:hypothetical protein